MSFKTNPIHKEAYCEGGDDLEKNEKSPIEEEDQPKVTLTPRDQNFQVSPGPNCHKKVIFSFSLFSRLQNYETSPNFTHSYLTHLSKV